MKVKNLTEKDKCSRCGNCCTGTGLPFTEKEADVIAEYIKSHDVKQRNREWVRRFEKTGVISDTVDTRCCFYDLDKKECAIYEARPAICRSYLCNKKPKVLEKEKMLAHSAAFYNRNNEPMNLTNFDVLFYGDLNALKLILFFLSKACYMNNGMRYIEMFIDKNLCLNKYEIE